MEEASSPTLEPQPEKEEPQSLVLRGRPRPVVRFRKRLIVAVFGIAAAIVAVLSVTALQPPAIHPGGEPEPRIAGAAAAEALDGAPKLYSDVPRLGPPLPGDLGSSILKEQRASAMSVLPPQRGSADWDRNMRARASDRPDVEPDAERSASVLIELGTSSIEQTSTILRAPSGTAQDRAPSSGPEIERSGGHDGEFNKPLGKIEADTGVPARAGPKLAAGTIIAASLITGVNSDVEGIVVAEVTQNVCDSATGQTILIPQGARLIGKYDTTIGEAQTRASIEWDRLVFPDGRSLELGKMPASDASGYSGVEGRVNAHEWQLIKGVMLSSVLGVGSELSLGGGGAIARAIRQSSQLSGARAGEQIVSHRLGTRPTITIAPGSHVNVLLAQDLALEPWNSDR